MLSVGVIGIGNAGSQVATLAKAQIADADCIVMNSSENDLATIPESITKIKLGDMRGAGKNRHAAKEFLKESITTVLNKDDFQSFMTHKDIVFVVSSMGGGTGSGISPMMSEILRKGFPDTFVILVGILPSLKEAYTTQINALEYVNELYKKLTKPTYMIYDNDSYADLNMSNMMEKINQAIVDDIRVLKGEYNYNTKYSSIDEKDMSLIISTAGRIVVASYKDIKEKDLDKRSIDGTLEYLLKNGANAELQNDGVILRLGSIANLNETLAKKYDDHLSELQDYVGAALEEFSHVSINEEKAIPNSVFFIGAGLSPIYDRIEKINERVEELDSIIKKDSGEEGILDAVDIQDANARRDYRKKDTAKQVDLNSIFNDFM